MRRYPIVHPADRMLEETFLDPYREGGAATLCMEWLRVKRHICWDSLESGAPLRILLSGVAKGTYTYNVFIPEYIKEEIEDFKSPERFPDFTALEKEIQNNLDRCESHPARIKYLRSLLDPFADYAHAFNPKAEIERWEAPKNTAQQLMKLWENMEPGAMNENTGEPLNPQYYIDRLRKAIESLEKEIAFQKQFQNYFLKYSNQGCTRNPSGKEQTMCVYLNFWRRQMYDFVQMLSSIASHYGIRFSEVQKQSGIYVLDADDLNDTIDSSLTPHTDEPSENIAAKTSKAQQETPSQSTNNKENQQKGTSKKKKDYPPYTFCYYNYRDPSIYKKQQKRVDLVFQLLTQRRCISPETDPDNFDRLFGGELIDCHIEWTDSAVLLTAIVKNLLKQNKCISKGTKVNTTSLIKGQFKKEPDYKANRIREANKNIIKLIPFILDTTNTLPEQRDLLQYNDKDNCYQLKETALLEVYNKSLRSTKGI